MNAPVKAKDWVDPVAEAKAVAALIEGLRAEHGDDPELLADMVEGESSLFEAIDKALERIREDEVMIAGLDAVIAGLSERKRRHEEAKKRARTLLEQALSIADLPKVVRPTATLSLSNRPPTVSVTEESDIPARFWKAGDPVLDKKALAEAVKAHADAMALEDPQARTAALAEAPEIPGATLTNGAPSLTIRTK